MTEISLYTDDEEFIKTVCVPEKRMQPRLIIHGKRFFFRRDHGEEYRWCEVPDFVHVKPKG